VAITAGGFFLWRYTSQRPKREALRSVAALQQGLATADKSAVLEHIILPAGLRSRTEPEQMEFLTKALRDEVSAEGLAVLRKRGTYGPLKEIFPLEAERWTRAAGVQAEDCVAFKAEKNGLRAEVVLVKMPNGYRVVRCNNVKQLAM